MRKKRPKGQNADPAPDVMFAGTVAELLGWSLHRLFAEIRLGTIPPPEVRGVWAVFPLTYVVHLKRDGLSLPGTFKGFPPGYSASREFARWMRVGDSEPQRYVKRSEVQATARRIVKGGAK